MVVVIFIVAVMGNEIITDMIGVVMIVVVMFDIGTVVVKFVAVLGLMLWFVILLLLRQLL